LPPKNLWGKPRSKRWVAEDIKGGGKAEREKRTDEGKGSSGPQDDAEWREVLRREEGNQSGKKKRIGVREALYDSDLHLVKEGKTTITRTLERGTNVRFVEDLGRESPLRGKERRIRWVSQRGVAKR